MNPSQCLADLLPDGMEVADLLVTLEPIHQNPWSAHQLSGVIVSMKLRDGNSRVRQGSIKVEVVEVTIFVELQCKQPIAQLNTKKLARSRRAHPTALRPIRQRERTFETSNQRSNPGFAGRFSMSQRRFSTARQTEIQAPVVIGLRPVVPWRTSRAWVSVRPRLGRISWWRLSAAPTRGRSRGSGRRGGGRR